MATYTHLKPPADADKVTLTNRRLIVPNNLAIPYIEGDGIGADLWRATRPVLDAAIEKAYKSARRVTWFEVLAGGKAHDTVGDWLPEDTLTAIREYYVAIKGPLTTPVAGGMRSLNAKLKESLDLYACIRPFRYYEGVQSPMKNPERLFVIIFRENTEDTYQGIEWQRDTFEANKLISILNHNYGKNIRPDSGITLKTVSKERSKRLVKRALEYTIERGRKSLTFVHKGNIQKFTEGAFKDWAYEACLEVRPDKVVTEDDLWKKHDGKLPEGKILIKDRIADAMFQQVQLRPDEYDVVATTNLNGDYLSSACAAQIGGAGLSPSANIGDSAAIFEAMHGTAPKYAGTDIANPGSLMLAGRMMFNHLGWTEAAGYISKGIAGAIKSKTVTRDLAKHMTDATVVKGSEFAAEVIKNM